MEDSKQILVKQWLNIYSSKQAKFIMVSNIQQFSSRKQGNHYIVQNPPYVAKLKKIDVKVKQNKTVFQAFQSNQPNFTNVSSKEIMFHLNLDSQEIITKQNVHFVNIKTYKLTQNFFQKDDEEDQIEEHAHVVLINTSPLCKNHSILIMYPDQQLPQIVGQDIVLLLLNIFKLFPTIKVAYNSIGAAAIVNHLHFHLFFSQDLIGESFLPIQKQPTKPWKQTTLINPTQQINLYSVGVRIQQMQGPISQGFVLSPLGQNLDSSEVASSLSFVFGVLVNELIQLCIPHNVLFSGNGNKIYVMVRQFADQKINYGWAQFCGVIPSGAGSSQLKQQQIFFIKKSLRVQPKLIQTVKSNVTKNLSNYI